MHHEPDTEIELKLTKSLTHSNKIISSILSKYIFIPVIYMYIFSM